MSKSLQKLSKLLSEEIDRSRKKRAENERERNHKELKALQRLREKIEEVGVEISKGRRVTRIQILRGAITTIDYLQQQLDNVHKDDKRDADDSGVEINSRELERLSYFTNDITTNSSNCNNFYNDIDDNAFYESPSCNPPKDMMHQEIGSHISQMPETLPQLFTTPQHSDCYYDQIQDHQQQYWNQITGGTYQLPPIIIPGKFICIMYKGI